MLSRCASEGALLPMSADGAVERMPAGGAGGAEVADGASSAVERPPANATVAITVKAMKVRRRTHRRAGELGRLRAAVGRAAGEEASNPSQASSGSQLHPGEGRVDISANYPARTRANPGSAQSLPDGYAPANFAPTSGWGPVRMVVRSAVCELQKSCWKPHSLDNPCVTAGDIAGHLSDFGGCTKRLLFHAKAELA
jgi:hypothetical protein